MLQSATRVWLNTRYFQYIMTVPVFFQSMLFVWLTARWFLSIMTVLVTLPVKEPVSGHSLSAPLASFTTQMANVSHKIKWRHAIEPAHASLLCFNMYVKSHCLTDFIVYSWTPFIQFILDFHAWAAVNERKKWLWYKKHNESVVHIFQLIYLHGWGSLSDFLWRHKNTILLIYKKSKRINETELNSLLTLNGYSDAFPKAFRVIWRDTLIGYLRCLYKIV